MTRAEIVALNRQGVLLQEAGETQEAFRAFSAAVDGLKEVMNADEEADILALCDLLTNVATVAGQVGDFEAARAAYTEANQTLDCLHPPMTPQRILRQVEILCGLASVFKVAGEEAEVNRFLEATEASLSTHGELLDDAARNQWLAKIRIIQGNLALDTYRFSPACTFFQEAIAFVRPYINRGQTFRSEAAHAALNLGTAYSQDRKWDDAERSLRLCCRLLHPLTEALPHLYGSSLLGAYAQLAFVYQNVVRPERLQRTLSAARGLQQQMGLPEDGEVDFDTALAVATLDYSEGMAAERIGRLSEAEQLFVSGLEWLSPFRGVSWSSDVIWVYCAERLTHLAIERRRNGEASYWTRLTGEWLEPDTAGQNRVSPEIGRLLIMLGAALTSIQEWEDARKALTEGIAILQDFAETTAYFDDLAAGLNNRSTVHLALGCPSQALEDVEWASHFIDSASGLYDILRANNFMARAAAQQALERLPDAESSALRGLSVLRGLSGSDTYQTLRARLWGATLVLETRCLEAT